MSKQGIKATVIAAALLSSLSASAQQAVKTVDEPYIPAGQAQEPDGAVIPVSAAKGVEEVIGANPFSSLVPNKTISDQLQKMAADAGWQLIWEAPDFSIEQKVTVSSDFVKAVTTVIESANLKGTRLKATFYRGNNLVRVTEL